MLRSRAIPTLASLHLITTACESSPPPGVSVESRTWIRNYGVPGAVLQPAAITALSDGGYGLTGQIHREGREALLLMKVGADGELVPLGGERALAIGGAATGIVPAGAGPTRDGGAALAGLSGGMLHVVRLGRGSEVEWTTEVRQIDGCEERTSRIHAVTELEDRALVVLGRCQRSGSPASFAAVLEASGEVRYAGRTLHRDSAADISLFAVTAFADRYYFGGRINDRCLVFGTPTAGGGTYSTFEEGTDCTITALRPVGGRLLAAGSVWNTDGPGSSHGPVLRAISLDDDLSVVAQVDTPWGVPGGTGRPSAGGLDAWPFALTSFGRGPLFFGPGPGLEAQVYGHGSANLDSSFFLDRLAVVNLEVRAHGVAPAEDSGTVYYGRYHVRLSPETEVVERTALLGCADGAVFPYSEPGSYLVFDSSEPCVARVSGGELLWRKTAVEGNGHSAGRAVAPAFTRGLLAAGVRAVGGTEVGLVVAHDGDSVVFERTVRAAEGQPSGFTAALRDGEGWVLGGYAGSSAWLVRMEASGEVGWSRTLPHAGAIRAMKRSESGDVWMTTGEVSFELDAAFSNVGATMVAPVADIAGGAGSALQFLQPAAGGWSLGTLPAGGEPSAIFLSTDPVAAPASGDSPSPRGSARLVRTDEGTRVVLVQERRGAGSCGEQCGDLGIWSGGAEPARMYGTGGDERLVDVTETAGGLVILGTTTGYRPSEQDVWLLKLDAEGAVGEGCDVAAAPVSVYSTPSRTASAGRAWAWPVAVPLGSAEVVDPRAEGLPVDAGRSCTGFVTGEPRWVSLEVVVEGGGMVTVSSTTTGGGRYSHCPPECRHEVPAGDSVVVVAEANPGWAFDGWTGVCARSGSGTARRASFPLLADESCTVSFTRTSTSPEGPLDCPDGVDGDDDGSVDEDRCVDPLQVTCSGDLSIPALSSASLRATVSGGAATARGWQVVSAPVGSTALPSPAGVEVATFTPLLAGTYRLRFTARDAEDQVSACETQLVATAVDRLRVELIWNSTVAVELDQTDLDLHLLEPVSSAVWFDGRTDCHWLNCTTSLPWGAPGPGDDPLLALDDREGRGPENINIGSPGVTELPFRVGVHFWANDARGAPAQAIVNIHCNGRLERSLGPVALTAAGPNLDENELWKVADVSFGPTGCSVVPLLEPDGTPLVVTTSEARERR
ncbi:MAG: hypothetical protein L6Q95_02895 [Planctomycetes bacterium]|nr:hypothetical protein [Planctomycetota bacterium]